MILLAVPLLVGGLIYGGREAMRRRQSLDLRRIAVFSGGVAAAAALGALTVGGSMGGGLTWAFVAAAALLAAGTLVLARREPAAADGRWTATATEAPAPTDDHRGGGASAPAVARALGRVEARELSRSPWFGVGIGFCALLLMLFGFVFAGEDAGTWDVQLQLSSWLALPLVGMVVLASHRAVTRAARDGADELFDTCPAAPATRTAGFLLAAPLPMAVITVFLVVLGIAVVASGADLYGPIGADSVADVAAAVLLGAGGVFLGAALGRWVRFGLAPVVAVVAVGIAGVRLNTIGNPGWTLFSPLSPAPAVHGTPPMFTDRPVWWHLVWIVGLSAIVGAAALARDRRDRPVVAIAAVAVTGVLVAGIGATRPMSPAAAARIAATIAAPQADQECTATGTVEICVFPIYRDVLGALSDRVAPIGAVLPGEAAGITLRQVYAGKLGALPPEVRRLLNANDLDRPAGEVPLEFDGQIVELAGLDLAHRVLGLPVEPDEDLLPTVVAGEARGVVVLWLATLGLDLDATAEAIADAERWTNAGVDDCEEPALAWSRQDVAAARAVVALPDDDVSRIVRQGWERWTDPRVGTDELLAALGLDPVGPFDEVVAQPGSSC
ncbi:MAG: hypothetical protein ACSLFP_10745 [Acidimicrobiales bacterium]